MWLFELAIMDADPADAGRISMPHVCLRRAHSDEKSTPILGPVVCVAPGLSRTQGLIIAKTDVAKRRRIKGKYPIKAA